MIQASIAKLFASESAEGRLGTIQNLGGSHGVSFGNPGGPVVLIATIVITLRLAPAQLAHKGGRYRATGGATPRRRTFVSAGPAREWATAAAIMQSIASEAPVAKLKKIVAQLHRWISREIEAVRRIDRGGRRGPDRRNEYGRGGKPPRARQKS